MDTVKEILFERRWNLELKMQKAFNALKELNAQEEKSGLSALELAKIGNLLQQIKELTNDHYKTTDDLIDYDIPYEEWETYVSDRNARENLESMGHLYMERCKVYRDAMEKTGEPPLCAYLGACGMLCENFNPVED